MGVAVPQDGREQLARPAVEDEERMVHVLAVVAVVVAAFLLSVGRIVRRVEVQEHALRGAVFAPLPD